MQEQRTTNMHNASAWSFRASFPVASQGRGNGTFLILLCKSGCTPETCIRFFQYSTVLLSVGQLWCSDLL